MSVLQENQVDHVATGYDREALAAICAGEPEALVNLRCKAFEAFAEAPFPTARDEEWRRTDPAAFSVSSWRRLPTLSAVAPSGKDPWDHEFDVVVAVSERGYSVEDQTGIARDGQVSILSLREAVENRPDLIAGYFRGAALPAKPRKFELLNAAFWNFGLVVHVRKGQSMPRGVLVRYTLETPGVCLLPRLLVVAEDAAEARVVEHFTSADALEVACFSAREFYAGHGASLKIVSVQEWGRAATQVGEDWARVGRDGRVDWVTLTLGAKVSKMMVGSDVSAPNASAYLSGIFFADGEQHFDQRTLQLHSAPDTYSNLLYKGAVKDRAHSIYQGVINAKPGAIRVDAYQMNNNLILNEGARADSLPGLEIDADDLKCSHGATMGSLDPDQLYYLRSRGLSELEARRLIVGGFFEEVLDKVPYAFVQERLREHIECKLSHGESP